MENKQLVSEALSQIFQNWEHTCSFVFSETEYDFQESVQTIFLPDSAGENHDWLKFNHSSQGEIASKQIISCYVYGLKLGLQEIPILAKDITMLEMIAIEEKKHTWVMNHKEISCFVEERIVSAKNGHPLVEFVIYNVSEMQWRIFMNRAVGSKIFREGNPDANNNVANELDLEIESMILRTFKCDKGSVYLLMSKVLADSIGIVPKPKEAAAEIFMQLFKEESIPQEIRNGGLDEVITYLKNFSYSEIRKIFMMAAVAAKNKLNAT